MKKAIIISSLFLINIFPDILFAQYGANISYIHHTGEMRELVMPTGGIEFVLHTSKQHHRAQISGSIGYFPLWTWNEKFYFTTIVDGVPYSGYNAYKKFYEIPIGLNFSHKLKQKPFSPIIGFDAYIHIIAYDYHYKLDGFYDSFGNDVTASVGILPKIGLIYDLSDYISFHSGIGYSMAINNEDTFTYIKIYSGLIYYL